LQVEIVSLRPEEQRVRENGVAVMPALAPLRPRAWPERERFRFRFQSRVEIKIRIDFIIIARPITLQQLARVKINDVGLEAEAEVRFRTCALNLMVPREGKYVVADNVRGAVMLMETAVGGAINQVALGHNAAGAFVEVNPPAAILQPRNIMPQIIPNDGARLDAQGVYAAHVAKDRPIAVGLHSDVMDVVEFEPSEMPV